MKVNPIILEAWELWWEENRRRHEIATSPLVSKLKQDVFSMPPQLPDLSRILIPAAAEDVMREQLDYLLDHRLTLSATDRTRLARVEAILLEIFSPPKPT